MNYLSINVRRILSILSLSLISQYTLAQSTLVSDSSRNFTFFIFALLFILTFAVIYLAAKKNTTTGDFYTGGGAISGRTNGIAIAGDYLSAAAFLGVSGLIALYGLDGSIYLVGFFVSFIPVLLLVAEPCRNLGKYTLGDILSLRNHFRSTKFVVAISSILVALFYMVPQIVGGAVIIKALIGIPYETSVVVVGGLMLSYVLFGGMRATTAIQLFKALVLISFCFLLVILTWIPYGFNVNGFFKSVVSHPFIQQHVLSLLGSTSNLSAAEAGQRFLEPGLYLKSPLEQFSLSLALVLGTAAMPHILMRFFTVANAQGARASALWAMLAIGVCHLFIIVIGFSSALNIGPLAISQIDKGGNLAAPMLAQYLGGGADSMMGNFLLALVAAVSFATIVAVVAGLTLAAASSLAHDVYVGAIKNGQATEREQKNAARIATIIMVLIAIGVGISAKGQNVAHLVGLGYAVAASANLPALLMTLYWKRCSTAGVLAGVIGGTVLSIGLVLISPNMTYPQLQKEVAVSTIKTLDAKVSQVESGVLKASDRELAEWKKSRTAAMEKVVSTPDQATSLIGLEKPMINLKNPGIISIPVGFLLVIMFSLLFPSRYSQNSWKEFSVRRESGLGVHKPVQH